MSQARLASLPLLQEHIINHEKANKIGHTADVRSSGEQVQFIIGVEMCVDNNG